MTIAEKAAAILPTQGDLKAMAQERGRCLSILLSVKHTSTNQQVDAARMRLVAEAARAKMAGLGLKLREIEEFVKPVLQISELESSYGHNDTGTHGLAIYRTAERWWHFRLPFTVPEYTEVASRFYVVPILKALCYTPEFYILVLSQKHTRLIRCTLGTSQEVPLPPTVPTNLTDFNQHSQPDHRLENRTSVGQKGSSPTHPGLSVPFGSSSDSDNRDEYLTHFYNELDKQLQVLLRDQPLPLIVSGVDYEIALYHRVSEYSALVAGGVQGAADGLKGGELHTRALQVLEQHNHLRAEKALQQFEKAGGERISIDVAEIVKHAFDGRILYLFLAEGARQPGSFEEATRQVQVASREEAADDLLNLAALQTIGAAGEVFVIPQDQVPGKAVAAAMLRF